MVDYGAAHTLQALAEFVESGGEIGEEAPEGLYNDEDYPYEEVACQRASLLFLLA